MEQLLQIISVEQFKTWVDELDQLQKNKNDGRGVSCVQTVVIYLRNNDIRSARAVCFTEADKIRNYPDIKEWIVENLFKGDSDYPWKFENGN